MSDGNNSAIDDIVAELPVMSDYAEDGSVYPFDPPKTEKSKITVVDGQIKFPGAQKETSPINKFPYIPSDDVVKDNTSTAGYDQEMIVNKQKLPTEENIKNKKRVEKFDIENLPWYYKGPAKLYDKYVADIQPSIDIYNELVDFKNTRGDGEMTKEEVNLRERILKANQYGYPENVEDVINFADRVEKGERGGNPNPYYQTGLARNAYSRKYYGLPYAEDQVPVSKYKPSNSNEPEKEYSGMSPYDKNRFIKVIKDSGISEDVIIKNSGLSNFGDFKLDTGVDEDGRKYISFYDVWDLNPPVLEGMGIDINALNNPFEFYDRVYFDEIYNDDKKENKKK